MPLARAADAMATQRLYSSFATASFASARARSASASGLYSRGISAAIAPKCFTEYQKYAPIPAAPMNAATIVAITTLSVVDMSALRGVDVSEPGNEDPGFPVFDEMAQRPTHH